MRKARHKRYMASYTAKGALIGYSFILPNFIGFLFFILIPVIFSFVLSFAKWDGFNAMRFIGVRNFTLIFTDRVFRNSLSKTIGYTVFTVTCTLALSLFLAVVLNNKLKGRDLFRSAIFFPYVASIVAVGAVWQAMFQKDFGPINTFLRSLGATNPPGWFASTRYAMTALIIVSVWKFMGYYMIIYLAALQDIPRQLYEAATIDGAGAWQQFRRVTVPMLTPATFFVFIMLTINSFKVFDLVYVLTEGGPGIATTVLVKYIYDQSFIAWNYGKASAASMVLFAIVGVVTVIQFRIERKWTSFM